MIDLSDFQQNKGSLYKKTIITCTIELDKDIILNILKHDVIKIMDRYCKVPEYDLLMLLVNKRFGAIQLSLEEIEKL